MTLLLIIFRIILSAFTLFFLSATCAASSSSNYVTLSISEQGLREVRVSFKNKMVLETSLADGGPSANGVALSRATDGKLLVETVARRGLIEDCSVVTSPGDVAAFVSDFARVRPEASFRNETELLDVYLGLKNISEYYSVSEHGGNPRFHPSAHGKRHPKMTAALGALTNSSFASMFQRFFRTKRIARDCEQFYKEAQRRLEVLTLLVQNADELESEASRLHLNGSRGREIFEKMQHRHRRRHHRHHHRRRRHHHQNHRHSGGDAKNVSQRELDVFANISSQAPNTSIDLSSDNYNRDSVDVIRGYFNDSKNSIVDKDAPSSLDNSSISDSDRGSSHESSFSSRTHSSPPTTGTLTTFSYPNTTSPIFGRNGRHFDNNAGVTTPGGSVAIPDSRRDVTAAAAPAGMTSSADLLHRSERQLTSSRSRKRSRARRDLLTGWMIFPGTKWCGDGDIAENKHDLGYHLELDKCCRRHDLCPLVIPRLSWKYGMFNYRLHTISHCRCDRKFRKCLKASDSPLAHLIGQIFFNVVGPQCFKFKQETTCVQRFWWGGCKEWGDSKVAYVKKQRRFK